MAIDRYLVPKGSTIYGGLPAPEASTYPVPLRTGGTVHALLGEWSGTGFHLLTTAPAAPIFSGSGHTGSVWDGENGVMWTFGAESHGAAGMDNAVYGWRVSDGKFMQMYERSPSDQYRMAADGTYWADAAHTKPWAMHTYRRLRFVKATSEIEVVYDPYTHASFTPPIFEQAGHTVANRVRRLWYYNVKTGTWRVDNLGASHTFIGDDPYAYPVGYSAGYGWFQQNGATWFRLSETGVRTTASVYGKSVAQQHSYMHVHNGIAYQVCGNSSNYLYSRHPLSNIAGTSRHASANYPALVGASTTNCASAMMPDGRIVIFGKLAGRYRAFILDPVADTVTDTGHDGPVLEKDIYDLAAEWSPEYQCAILISRLFSPNRVYAYRPE